MERLARAPRSCVRAVVGYWGKADISFEWNHSQKREEPQKWDLRLSLVSAGGEAGQMHWKLGAARNEVHVTGRLKRATKGINRRAAIL